MRLTSTSSQGRRANSIHMLAGQLLSKGALFVSMMMLSRHLDDQWFGRLLFALVLSFFSFFITDFGTAVLVNRDMSMASMRNSAELWRSALGFRTVTGLFSMALIGLFSFLRYPVEQTMILVPVLIGVTLEIYSELPFAFFRASGRARQESSARFIASIIFLASIAAGIRAGLHPGVLAIAFLLRGAALAFASFRAVGEFGLQFRPSFKGEHLLRLLKEAWPLGVMGFLTVLHQRVDNLVIEERLGVVNVGAYNEIFKVVEVLILIVTPTLLPGALFPDLCRAFGAGVRESSREMKRIALIISAISAVIVALVIPPGQLFMRFLWGGAYLRGVTPEAFNSTRLLLFSAIPLFYLMNFLLAALIASGKQKSTIPAVFAGFAVSLLLNLLLVGRMGLSGAAVAAMASNLVIAGVCRFFLGRSAHSGVFLSLVLGVLPVPVVLALDGRLPWPLVSVAGLICALPAILLCRDCLRRGELPCPP